MESVNIPSETVPQEMKACEQILRRAKELKKAEPVVAYWCMFHSPRGYPAPKSSITRPDTLLEAYQSPVCIALISRLLFSSSTGFKGPEQIGRRDQMAHVAPRRPGRGEWWTTFPSTSHRRRRGRVPGGACEVHALMVR